MPTFRTEDFEDAEETGKLALKEEKKNSIASEPDEDEDQDPGEAAPDETSEGSDAGTEGGDPKNDRPAAKKNRLAEVELSDEDLPEDLRGKIKTGKDLLDLFENTRTFAKDLYNRVGAEDKPAPKEEPLAEDEPLFSEDDLGIGADPKKVEAKLNELVNKRVSPYVTSALQDKSEKIAKQLFSDKDNYPFAERFKNEILTLASRLDLNLTAREGTWHNLYAQVVGSNANVLLKERETAKPKPAPGDSERGDNGGSTNRRKATAEDDFETRVKNAKLSPEQKMVAEAMGVTEDAYIRRALKMGIELNGRL